ncbi:MAG: TM0106 family RecB-like putative nuclease [Candidatus Thiodiazotropha sp. (ex Ctena orbiculata)]|nr:TM0106 family RecB-like putative nuclease [Candidatus Thiodiazotropha taylori]
MIGKNKQFLIKPSDAESWSQCARRVWLDNKGDFEQAPTEDEFEQLVIQLGLEHEKRVLEKLAAQHEIQTATSPEHTAQLMADGVPVIYQAQLLDQENGFTGFPDFLIRHESGKYQPADAKLSLSEEKKNIQVQLGFYRRMLGTDLPAIVFLGDGSEALIGDEANKLTNQFVTEMRELLSSDEEPAVRYSHSKCRACPYYAHCKPKFESKDELSLLYGIQGRAALGLEHAGIDTITKLSGSDPNNIEDVPYLKGLDKKHRAVLQAKAHLTGEVFLHNPITLPEGQWIHFDIEDNPLTACGDKHVYLCGFLVPEYANEHFEYVWTDHEEEDEHGWLQFLKRIEEYREKYPSLILAHYSSHERSTIKAYAKRYNMEGHETVAYLLGDDSPLFDIQKPVLESLVLPLQGYGLKDICKHKSLVNFQWEDDSSGSQWSVVQFNRFLAESNHENRLDLKGEILGYNRDDVIATRRLEEWLRTNFMD